MGGGASSSLHAVSTLGLGETSRHKLSAPPATQQAEMEACGTTMLASWGHGHSPTFCGECARNPSLQEADQDPHHNLGEGIRLQALGSPSPKDPGRSQALKEESQSSCPASVLIGAWVQECELLKKMHDQLRKDMQSLRECVSLLLSECRHNFQELQDSLGTAKLGTGEDNRVDFTQNKQQQQLGQQKQEQADEQEDRLDKADLDSQPKLEKKKRKKTRKRKKQQVAWEQTSYNEHQQEAWCNNSLGTNSSLGTNNSIGTTSSLGTIAEEEPTESFDQEKCMILVDTGAELSVAPWALHHK